MNLAALPHLNALLNASSACVLMLGYVFIRNKNTAAHMKCMLGALATSGLFLVSYLIYHYFHGTTRYTGPGMWRVIYFSILTSHTILAVVMLPFIGFTIKYAIKGSYERHRWLARWTFPIWLYVSLTGVLIYAFLYVF